MIVIKDMEMPKNCFRCDLACKYRWYLDTDTRPYNCPLVEVPSVEPERKTGKWVRYDGDWFKTMCKCSECGAMIDINEKYRNLFCYHCGSRMDGGQE